MSASIPGVPTGGAAPGPVPGTMVMGPPGAFVVAPPSRPALAPPEVRHHAVGPTVLVLIAVAILVLTLFFPWNSIFISGSSQGTTATVAIDFDTLGLCEAISGNVHQSSSNGSTGFVLANGTCLPWWGFGGPSALKVLGLLYTIGEVLEFAAIIVGAVGAALGFRLAASKGALTPVGTRRPFKYARYAAVLALVGGLIFFLLDTLIIGFLSSGVCSGSSQLNLQVWGSCTFNANGGGGGTSTPVTVSWAPGLAFYLMIAAFVVLLIAASLLRRTRDDLRPWVPDATGGGSIVCGVCGQTTGTGRFCGNCGAPLLPAGAIVMVAPPAPLAAMAATLPPQGAPPPLSPPAYAGPSPSSSSPSSPPGTEPSPASKENLPPPPRD